MNRDRKDDLPIKWGRCPEAGGAKFPVVCPENDLKGVSAQAEHLRLRLAEIPCAVSGRQTASFGVACLAAGESRDDLVRRADDALYPAKKKGRNTVEKTIVDEYPFGSV